MAEAGKAGASVPALWFPEAANILMMNERKGRLRSDPPDNQAANPANQPAMSQVGPLPTELPFASMLLEAPGDEAQDPVKRCLKSERKKTLFFWNIYAPIIQTFRDR